MSDITRMIEAVKSGDQRAAEKLFSVTYTELRRMAQRMMSNERADHTLQPTALIHEAYLRLVGAEGEQPDWHSRGYFFTAAAEAMRRILVDHARRNQSLKRGGDQVRTAWQESQFEFGAPAEELVAVDEVLAKFEVDNPDAAKIVKLRYFAGMTVDETATALGISASSVNRTWRAARAWLFRELQENREKE